MLIDLLHYMAKGLGHSSMVVFVVFVIACQHDDEQYIERLPLASEATIEGVFLSRDHGATFIGISENGRHVLLQALSHAKPWRPDVAGRPSPSPPSMPFTVQIRTSHGLKEYLFGINGRIVSPQNDDLPFFEVPIKEAETVERILLDAFPNLASEEE